MSTLDSIDVGILHKHKVEELKVELRFRRLPDSGLKDELVDRILVDNQRLDSNGTHVILIAARTKRDEDALKISDMEQKINALTFSQPGASNQNSDAIMQVICQLAATQKQIADHISASAAPMQVFSTNDSAAAIPVFSGHKTDKAEEWIKEVERISSHTHWTPSLTMVNAATRLQGSALNWHKVVGKRAQTWDEWKALLIERFKLKMSFADFILHQGKRHLRSNETIVEYIYEKDALIENSPFTIEQKERISLIIEGITDTVWSVPLATQRCSTVVELIDHALPLDAIRKVKTDFSQRREDMSRRDSSDGQRRTDGRSFHRFNPEIDRKEEQTCFRCKKKGHISYDCPEPPSENRVGVTRTPSQNVRKAVKTSSAKSDQPGVQVSIHQNRQIRSNTSNLDSANQVNCVQGDGSQLTLIPVTLGGVKVINALPDSGSVITLIRRTEVPVEAKLYPWQKGGYKVAGNIVTPLAWFTSRLQVGSIDYIMPQIAVCEYLPVPFILGRDWQHAVYARVIHEPDGGVCIMTPTHTETYECVSAATDIVGCVISIPRHQERLNLQTNEPVNCGKGLKSPSSDGELPVCEEVNEVVSRGQTSELQQEKLCNPPETDVFLTRKQEQEIDNLVQEYSDIFATSDNDLGEFPDFELEINLEHDRPISCRPYRLTEPERQFLKKKVEDWLQQGVCRISKSPYAAPMFVVEQPFHPTTSLRPVADFSRTINSITVSDPQPIDRMDDIVPYIAQFRYKFLLDVFHAYHNIKIRESDVHKTAVVTPDYHIEFLRVIEGLVGGPAIMSRVIKASYGQLYEFGVRTYFDDIPGGAHTFEELLLLLRRVFEATRVKNLKLKREKCIFAAEELSLFGRIVSTCGERPDPKRTSAVDRYTTLNSIHEVRSFLGFANAFRRYLKEYAMIARPLTDLLKGTRLKKLENVPVSQSASKNAHVDLDPKQQEAFEKLKQLITTPPVLSFFKQGAPTFVETDASYAGMGACLIQEQNGRRCVIEYASRALKDAETRYHINELEVAAVYWALVEKFRIYLIGAPFVLLTDNFTTAYVVNKAKLNRKFARYVVELAMFNFTSNHRPGKDNVIADHLSRYPQPLDMCLAIVTSNESRLKSAQRADGFTKMILDKLEKEPSTPHLRQIHGSYMVENGILIHIAIENGRKQRKIVVPQALKSTVLKVCHDDSGHFCSEATIARVKAKYWWKSIRSDVKAYTKACLVCARVNRRTVLAYGLLGRRPIPETPWQIVSADHILALPKSEAGNIYILVHVDHATRYVLARPTCSLAAKDVIHTFEQDIVFTYGPPLTYISDGGTCFTSQQTQHTFAKYGVEHLQTTPYTPQSNGLVERANATLIATLTKMALDNPQNWDKLLSNVLLTINTAQQKTTRYSPFYLLHGYQPRIPPNEIHLGSIAEDAQRLEQLDLLAMARGIAIENICDSHIENKNRFDSRRLQHNFKKGDIVLYNWPQDGVRKLKPKFKGPYCIEQKIGSVCYRIRDVNTPSKVKTAHVQFLRYLPDPPNFDSPPELFGGTMRDESCVSNSEEDMESQESHTVDDNEASTDDETDQDETLPLPVDDEVKDFNHYDCTLNDNHLELEPKTTRIGRYVKPPRKFDDFFLG